MWHYSLLFLLPVVLGCTNPDSDPCASFISASPATASPFCASFTQSVVTATTALPTWATLCSNKPATISKECTCFYGPPTATGPGGVVPTLTTVATPSATASNTCGSAPVNQLVGYAAGTTGGGSGNGRLATTCAELAAAVDGAGIIVINGILTGCGLFNLKSDTTIIGVGANSGLTGGGFVLKSISNVILRNLKMHDPPESDDLISLDLATNVWVDHCDLSTDGLVGDKDFYDGLLDITHASDFVTVSWTKFHDHWKGSLIGHSDNNAAQDTGHLRVTYHHNYWTNVNSRLPSIRFGTGHIYSSCFENNPTSGINSRMNAQVLVEQSSFLNTKLAITTDLDSDLQGFAVSRNNVFTNSTTDITQVGTFTSPPYSYTADSVSCVCALVKAVAGTGIIA